MILLNPWTDFDEFFCVCLRGYRDGLASQLEPVGGAGSGFFKAEQHLPGQLVVYIMGT